MESVRIEKLIPGGQALGTLKSGKKIMFWGTLPGELVTKWQITKDKNSFAEGIATEIKEISPHRVSPQDECYLATSPWQILDFDYEGEQKRELVREVFRQQKVALPEDMVIQPALTDGNEYHYRNKMEYALYYQHEDARIYPAFRLRGTHRKIPVMQSNLEQAVIWQRAQAIIAQLNSEHQDARQFQSLLLRCNLQGDVSGGLIENHQSHPKFPLLSEELLGHKYTLSPNGFFQINVPVYELVLTEMQKWIQTPQVLDLYAGVGTIGLSVARDRDLTLVECDRAAYQEMVKNCQGTGAKPILAKTEDALEYVQPEQTVIVDPPRAGCLPSVIEKLHLVLPKRIIYLSCNPITQARDLAGLIDKYELLLVQSYNFFPHTPHIENLVILERKAWG